MTQFVNLGVLDRDNYTTTQKILVLKLSNPKMTRGELAKLLGIGLDEVADHLAEIKARLELDGSRDALAKAIRRAQIRAAHMLVALLESDGDKRWRTIFDTVKLLLGPVVYQLENERAGGTINRGPEEVVFRTLVTGDGTVMQERRTITDPTTPSLDLAKVDADYNIETDSNLRWSVTERDGGRGAQKPAKNSKKVPGGVETAPGDPESI